MSKPDNPHAFPIEAQGFDSGSHPRQEGMTLLDYFFDGQARITFKNKEENGWEYGKANNIVAKTHPNMLPYEALEPNQQTKDKLFLAVVKNALESELKS